MMKQSIRRILFFLLGESDAKLNLYIVNHERSLSFFGDVGSPDLR